MAGGFDQEDVLRRVRCRERRAEEELHAWLVPILLDYVERRLSERVQVRVDPEDVVHDTFSQVLSIVRWDSRAVTNLEALAKTIARHTLHKIGLRRSLDFKPLQDDSGSSSGSVQESAPQARTPGPSTQLMSSERRELLEQALRGLPPEHALIVRLRYLDGERRRSFQDIAEIVGMTPAAVEKAYQRAREKVKAALSRKRRRNDSSSWV
jgi:RNA polymerase sigma factor (sigma-70 family)